MTRVSRLCESYPFKLPVSTQKSPHQRNVSEGRVYRWLRHRPQTPQLEQSRTDMAQHHTIHTQLVYATKEE